MSKKQKKFEQNNEKFLKFLNIARIVKNTVCWVLIAALSLTVLVFLITRINGGTPTVFGYTIQRISTGSMEPELMVGDVILSKDIDDVGTLKTDDIITFQGGAQFEYNRVTHRVVTAPHTVNGVFVLQTKGDANAVEDPEISEDAVLSKYIRKIDILSKLYNLFLSPWGLIIFVALLLFVFFDEVVNIVRILTGNYPDEEEEDIVQIIERIQREDAEKDAEQHGKKKNPNNSSKNKKNSNDKKKNGKKQKYQYKGTKRKKKKRSKRK